MEHHVSDNKDFELNVGGQAVFALYSRRGSTLVIAHVEAQPALRGRPSRPANEGRDGDRPSREPEGHPGQQVGLELRAAINGWGLWAALG